MITITKILDQTSQGMTKPIICADAKGIKYIAKFYPPMTADGMVKEWFGAKLAQSFGLPVPDFDVGFLNDALSQGYPFVENSPTEELVFLSKQVMNTTDFLLSCKQEIPISLQEAIWVFDRWMHNHDRNLNDQGGNVNLLWSIEERAVRVIDHNLIWAFDERYASSHVFDSVASGIKNDMIKRLDFERRMKQTLQSWSAIRSSCPKEWLTIETLQLDLDVIYAKLLTLAEGELWN